MGTFGGNKKVQAPVYKEFEGNQYTDYLDQDMGQYHDWLQGNWENAVTAPQLSDYYDYAKAINQPAMQDFLQDYNTQANKIAARNYNRFGGLGSTPALYTQDMLNKQMNDQSTRLAAQTLSDAYSMKNTDWANQLNAMNTVYNMYNQAGNYVTQNRDIPNWNTRNQNIANATAAENYNRMNSGGGFNIGNAISGAASGAMQGGSIGGGWGALAGGVLGGALGGFSGGSGQQASGIGQSMGNIGGNASNWLNNKRNGTSFSWKS